MLLGQPGNRSVLLGRQVLRGLQLRLEHRDLCLQDAHLRLQLRDSGLIALRASLLLAQLLTLFLDRLQLLFKLFTLLGYPHDDAFPL